MGGSVGKSQSDANTQQQVFGPQSEALSGLYDQAGQLFANQDYSGINSTANSLAPFMQDVMGGAAGGYDKMLAGGSVQDTSGIMDQLMSSLNSTAGGSQTGKMYESIVGGEGNTYIDPMVDAMKRSGMENLDRMQAGTGLEAAAMGQGGSSRHAMQNAMQARDMNMDMMDREAMMRGGAYDTDLNMKLDIARQADQGIQSTQDRLMGLLNQSDQNTQAGMGFGNMMQALGMGSMAPQLQANQAPWTAMGQYANAIGAPTVLGSGDQSGKGVGGSASAKG